MDEVVIAAPVSGWAAPLEETPDPVFAERLMGDGAAIHPTGSTVHAPCDGIVATLHPAGHAVTIRHASGAEILVHVGLETVALGGRGFSARVAEGAAVASGQPLIDLDIDMVAQAATSMITPVVVINSDAFRVIRRASGEMVAAGTPLLALVPEQPGRSDAATSGADTHEGNVTVPLAHGIHARPAARIAECARRFEADVEIIRDARRASARSPVAIMALGIGFGDGITVTARGAGAREAVAAVVELIAGGMGGPAGEAETAASPAPPPPPLSAAAVDVPEGALAGVAAAPGLAIGPAWWLDAAMPTAIRDAADPAAERAALDTALSAVRARLADSAERGGGPQRQILTAHLAFVDDEELLSSARAHIAAGRSAGFAWSEAIAAQAAALRRSGDARFAERADDLVDIERQVLLALAGSDPAEARVPPGAILLADELLPSQLVALKPGSVAGIVLARGGATSHVAILAASAGLPMLVAAGAPLSAVTEGTMLALDAEAGLVHVAPGQEMLAGHRERIARAAQRKAEARAAAGQASRSADGTRIEVMANLGSAEDAARAVANGAEGSGLVRTEFLFLDRREAPGEDEQHMSYQAIAGALVGRPVIVRLLDIGGDKPAPWLPMAAEANPMLGQRGIRATLARPDLLETQLRAIMRVKPAGQCRIMVPMVTGIDELRAVRAAAVRAATALKLAAPPQIGAMIETPAAAVTAHVIASQADFLSIGTNDLTQYTLAMDRENAAVASQVDALHPAVLRLIGLACEGAGRHGRPVGVCGGLASDRLGIPLLLGLGVTELSATPAFVPEAKALVRRLDLDRCRALAEQAHAMESAAQVRALARAFIEELD